MARATKSQPADPAAAPDVEVTDAALEMARTMGAAADEDALHDRAVQLTPLVQSEPTQPDNAPAKGDSYRVLHGAVGTWTKGQIILASELDGIDVDRLLRLGAIETTEGGE